MIPNQILMLFNLNPEECKTVPFLSIEDQSTYEVWKIETFSQTYVLKKAKQNEAEIYQTLLLNTPHVPKLYQTASFNHETYLLMEYIQGQPMTDLTQSALKLTLDTLIEIQKKHWNHRGNIDWNTHETFHKRITRGQYLCDEALEACYQKFLECWKMLPCTLVHDDLLPFNVLINETEAVLIDWECAGILPYPISFARLIAHADDSKDSLFHLTEENKAFAVDYYYDHLVSLYGISRNEFEHTLNLFLFYEYCEWIMLYNRYENGDAQPYHDSMAKAKHLLSKINSPKEKKS